MMRLNFVGKRLQPIIRSVNFQERALSLSVVYKQYGAPSDVLHLEKREEKSDKLGANEVALRMLGAPINPADLFAAQGKYGIQPPLPAVAGGEGVAKVENVGSGVKSLAVGDWVLPHRNPFGTWTQQVKVNENDVIKVSNEIPMPYAATLNVNPSTAYRLIKDFEKFAPGDVIIQNVANSMVGLAVIQIARSMGLRTINVIRSRRPDAQRVFELLHYLGGDVNIDEEYLNTEQFRSILADLPPVRLALNGSGGECASDFARILAPNGTMVTYGMMSGRPVVIPSELLAYKQLKMKGFWMAEWYKNHSKEEASAMHADLVKLIKDDHLTFFYELHDLDDFAHALKTSQEPFYLRKVVLNCDFPDRLAEHDARPEKDYAIFEDVTPL